MTPKRPVDSTARKEGELPLPLAVGLELLVWLLPSAAFLAVFVFLFHRSGYGALPHLGLIVTPWLVWVAARISAGRLGLEGHALRAVLSFLPAALFLCLGAYYSLVILGLHYWNNVISWEVLRTYSRQIRPLADSMEIPLSLPVLVGLGLLLILWSGIWLYLVRPGWPLERARRADQQDRPTPTLPIPEPHAEPVLVICQLPGSTGGTSQPHFHHSPS